MLFADAATGAHSPALVSQGKIGAVIAAKPVERRMLLEEAAGISGLHARRKDAEQKLRAPKPIWPGWAKSSATRSSAPRNCAARPAPPSAIASSPTRSAGSKRGCFMPAGPKPNAPLRRPRLKLEAAAEEVERIHQAIAEAQAAHDRATQTLTEKRNALDRNARGRPCARAPARCGPGAAGHDARRLAELDRLDASLKSDIAREEALKVDAARAIARSMRNGQRSRRGSKIRKRIRRGSRRNSAPRKPHRGKRRLRLPNCSRDKRRCAPSGGSLRRRSKRPRANMPAPSRNGKSSPSSFRCWATASDQVRVRDEAEAKAKAAARSPGQGGGGAVDADEGRGAAAERRDSAESRLASARAALSAARSEHEALARALDHGGGAAIASLKAEPGYERALAAALGEDADAAIGGDAPAPLAGHRCAARRSEVAAGHRLPRRPCDRANGTAAPPQAGRGGR